MPDAKRKRAQGSYSIHGKKPRIVQTKDKHKLWDDLFSITESQISILKERVDLNQELDDKVDALAKERFLSPRRRMELKRWKVLRLRCRDTITHLRKELDDEVDGSKEG